MSFSFCTLQLKLCLCEALYLPALRATSFQKEANRCALRAILIKQMRPEAATALAFLWRKVGRSAG